MPARKVSLRATMRAFGYTSEDLVHEVLDVLVRQSLSRLDDLVQIRCRSKTANALRMTSILEKHLNADLPWA